MLYTSEITKETYETVEKLEAAEKAYKEAHDAELKAKEARQADLISVKDAAQKYLDLIKANNTIRKDLQKKEEEAYKAYKAQLDTFDEKHNGYHLTYRRNGDNVEFNIEENRQKSLSDFFDEQRKAFKTLFDNFWF